MRRTAEQQAAIEKLRHAVHSAFSAHVLPGECAALLMLLDPPAPPRALDEPPADLLVFDLPHREHEPCAVRALLRMALGESEADKQLWGLPGFQAGDDLAAWEQAKALVREGCR